MTDTSSGRSSNRSEEMKNEDRFDSGSDEDEKLISKGGSRQSDEDGGTFVYGFLDLFSGLSPCAGEEEAAHISQQSTPEDFNTTEDSKNQASKPLSISSSSKDSSSDELALNSSSATTSRYLDDFVQLKKLGEGAFGSVWRCRHKIDGKEYAVKRIRMKGNDPAKEKRVLREATTLSSLQHHHVVRYYQAWIGTGVAASSLGSESYSDSAQTESTEEDINLEPTYLYIQMEYCPRTLKDHLDEYLEYDKDFASRTIRQIVEGLAHIHERGIVHRDLAAANIFIDAQNDIKIGDFGLAKFLDQERDEDWSMGSDGEKVDSFEKAGALLYKAPEYGDASAVMDEKADIFSLGIVVFELWHPFTTGSERYQVLQNLKLKGELPIEWTKAHPEQTFQLLALVSPTPSARPSAKELLRTTFPPTIESELLESILGLMKNFQDSSLYNRVVKAIFDRGNELSGSRLATDNNLDYKVIDTENRERVVGIAKEVFKKNGAKHIKFATIRLLGPDPNMNSVKVLTNEGDMMELSYELRVPFAHWININRVSSVKRYEISNVYRKTVGHCPPKPCLQADFDIIGGDVIGGTPSLLEAEVLKVVLDITDNIFPEVSCDIHVNHGDLLEAIWNWVGIKSYDRKKVTELLCMMGSLRPGSSEREQKWTLMKLQLEQDLGLSEKVIGRLNTVSSDFCGAAEQVLPSLRNHLPNVVGPALDELSTLSSCMRVDHVYIDLLMPPTEYYHRSLFFQVFLAKENTTGILIAIGGRYDYNLFRYGEIGSDTSDAVGVSLALETMIQHLPSGEA